MPITCISNIMSTWHELNRRFMHGIHDITRYSHHISHFILTNHQLFYFIVFSPIEWGKMRHLLKLGCISRPGSRSWYRSFIGPPHTPNHTKLQLQLNIWKYIITASADTNYSFCRTDLLWLYRWKPFCHSISRMLQFCALSVP